jgi:hypothetical protein
MKTPAKSADRPAAVNGGALTVASPKLPTGSDSGGFLREIGGKKRFHWIFA